MQKNKILCLLLVAALLLLCVGCSPADSAPAPIVVLGPMDSEYAILAGALKDPVQTVSGNYTFTAGTLDGTPVVAVRCLMGMENAAAATTLAIERYQPRCVIIQGTSGGHQSEQKIGDIILGENIRDINHFYTPHRDLGEGSHPEDWQPDGAEMLENGELVYRDVFHSDPALLAIAEAVPYEGGTVRRGTIGSGNIWNRELDRIQHLHETYGTDCEEMEGFAVAQVCAAFGVPMLAVRIISDLEFAPEGNFEAYGAPCQNYCLDVIRAIAQEG